MSKLYLYNIFHLNLAFSSIPEDDYPAVIERCYWPLIELAEEGIPIGIEATAHTLKEIDARDSSFIKKLSGLWAQGRCEFIGSGLSQIIMPLTPADVNGWNLDIGNRRYREFFGRAPEVAYINEQAYSKGIADMLVNAGYSAAIMDWDNCYRFNRYPKELLYYPQVATGISKDINLLWNHSIAFQKFQRCVYGDITEREYLDYLFSHHGAGEDRAYPVYGNDAEVFDYRPGHGLTPRRGEFKKMRDIFCMAAERPHAAIVTPGEVLRRFKGHHLSYRRLKLESTETPVAVKKQEKYNPIRWAVTGRDSVHMNTECYRVYENIKALSRNRTVQEKTLDGYREVLAELWGSDFRTNTIDEKFLNFQNKLGWIKIETDRLLGKGAAKKAPVPEAACQGGIFGARRGGDELSGAAFLPEKALPPSATPARPRAEVISGENLLKIKTGAVEAEFLPNKGCALKSLVFPGVSAEPLIGTLTHGYYDDIRLGADFFTGHLIHIARDGKKTTDLNHVMPAVEEGDSSVIVRTETPIEIGTLWKKYEISKKHPEISVTYRLKVTGLLSSSLRLGIFTFMPGGFDRDSLWFETVNGGQAAERFYLKGHSLAHDEPVSQSVSASGCLGATEGWIKIGDKDKSIRFHTDKSRLFSVPMLRYTEIDQEETFFLRLYHSLGEVDDTAWWVWRGYNEVAFSVTAQRT